MKALNNTSSKLWTHPEHEYKIFKIRMTIRIKEKYITLENSSYDSNWADEVEPDFPRFYFDWNGDSISSEYFINIYHFPRGFFGIINLQYMDYINYLMEKIY